jgi:DNA-directed RNA polymerase specialized sigma24 family protein
MVFYSDAKKEGRDPSKSLMEELARMFTLVAKGFLRKPCFSKVDIQEKEDMIQDAVYICVKYMGTYNSDIYHNPFAYFTSAIHNSFLQSLNKHKRKETGGKAYTKHIIDTEFFVTYSSWVPKPTTSNNFTKDWNTGISDTNMMDDEEDNLMLLLDDNKFLFFENTFEFEKENLDDFFGSENE